MDRLPIEKLLDDLAGPIMSWRMANGELHNALTVADPDGPRYRSARTRWENALRRAETLIEEYRASQRG